MFTRALPVPPRSFFLFGPRGTDKPSWVRRSLPEAVWFDLLDARVHADLLGDPTRIEGRVPRWALRADRVERPAAPAGRDEPARGSCPAPLHAPAHPRGDR